MDAGSMMISELAYMLMDRDPNLTKEEAVRQTVRSMVEGNFPEGDLARASEIVTKELKKLDS